MLDRAGRAHGNLFPIRHPLHRVAREYGLLTEPLQPLYWR